MTTAVRVSAPSRLHFGLLRFGHDPTKSFGGLGMMIDQPRVEVELQPANQWHAEGPQSDRALQVAQSVTQQLKPDCKSPLHIRVFNLPPAHCGLGTGTQLDFSIAAGIYRLLGFNIPSADELATVTNRGKRSAVGSHGFLSGGFIWETGQQQSNSLGSLAQHLMVPPEWHILLIRLPEPAGLHGKTEGAAFDQLPAIPVEVTQKMQSLAEQDILPAVQISRLHHLQQRPLRIWLPSWQLLRKNPRRPLRLTRH